MTSSPASPPPRRRNPLLGPDALTVDQPSDDATTVDATSADRDDQADRADRAGTNDQARPREPAATAADTGHSPSPSSRPASRRFDPDGKHALFSTPPLAAPDQLRSGSRSSGRDAFYSTGARQPGTVVVQCATCTVRSRVTLLDLGIRFLSISAWVPGRRHSHWMRCPACQQHTWCRVGWTD